MRLCPVFVSRFDVPLEYYAGTYGGAGIAIVLISLTINLILFWALSGLESRVKDLEEMHKEKDDDDEIN